MRFIRRFKQDLAKEVTEWVADDLIDEDQAILILQRYGITPGQPYNLGYTLLIGLGFLFIGLSVITLIGANWDEIPRVARMSGLIALTAGTHLVGIWFYGKTQVNKSVAYFFLGNLFFGGSIILIAQIYHLGEHMPDGVYWWALGCLPLAVLLRSRLLAIQMMVLALLWFYLEIDLGYYPTTVPLFVAAAAYVVVRSEGSAILFLIIFATLGLWMEYSLSMYWKQGASLRWEAEHLIITVSFFAAAYGFSQWLVTHSSSIAKEYGALLGVWCLRFVLILTMFLSFKGPWQDLINADWNHLPLMSFLSMLLWTLAAYFVYISRHYLPTIVFFLLFFSTSVLLIGTDTAGHAIFFQVVYNMILVGLGVWLIIGGISTNISHDFWTGVCTLLAMATLRYIDLIGGYVGGAILFMMIAGILLGAAHYWKRYQLSEAQ